MDEPQLVGICVAFGHEDADAVLFGELYFLFGGGETGLRLRLHAFFAGNPRFEEPFGVGLQKLGGVARELDETSELFVREAGREQRESRQDRLFFRVVRHHFLRVVNPCFFKRGPAFFSRSAREIVVTRASAQAA